MIERIPLRTPTPSKSLLKAFGRFNGVESHPRRVFVPQAGKFLNQRTYTSSRILRTRTISTAETPFGKPKRTLSLRPLIWATLGIILGMGTAKYVSQKVAGVSPEMPAPGSAKDLLLIEMLNSRAAGLPIVRTLTSDPEWESWDAYGGSENEKQKVSGFTRSALGGARAIGAYQRIFYNKGTGEVISVVFIGRSVSGWPGIVHGGLLATLMDESLARCGMLPRNSGVLTAYLNLNYRARTSTDAFYVIRAWPLEQGSTDRKAYIRGTLEEANTEKICVEADGLFIIPKHLEKEMKYETTRRWTGF